MNKEQVTSLIRMLAILVVSIAGMFGLTVDEDVAQTIVIGIAMLALIIYACWKNHNLTVPATYAQEILDLLKKNLLTPEQVQRLIDEAENAKETSN